MATKSAPSQRMLRTGELIRHALAEMILRGEAGDPELDKLVPSIAEVQVSPDLKIATAFVRSLLVGKEQLALEALDGFAGSFTSWRAIRKARRAAAKAADTSYSLADLGWVGDYFDPVSERRLAVTRRRRHLRKHPLMHKI